MDLTGGLGSTRQVLETLKSLPTWLLVGCSISLLTIWFYPPFRALLSSDYIPYLLPGLFVSLILTTCNVLSIAIAHRSEKRRVAFEYDRDRLTNLYRPLASLFMTRHATGASGSASRYLRQRVANAWVQIGFYRRRWVGVKQAYRALFDRQELTQSVEMDFNASFPMSNIANMVASNPRYASRELINLVSHAHRSREEDPGLAFLTNDELALLLHIEDVHDRLSIQVEGVSAQRR